MAACFSVPAWGSPGTEEPGELQSIGLQRVRTTEVTEHTHRPAHELETCLNTSDESFPHRHP